MRHTFLHTITSEKQKDFQMKRALAFGKWVFGVSTLWILTFAFTAATARGDWPSDPTVNVPISTAANSQQYPQLVSDGAGGAIITWQDDRNSGYAQRVSASGAVLWTTDGVPVAAGFSASPQLVSDGAGGAIITWFEYRDGDDIYAQRVNMVGPSQWQRR
ncbi:hypothetical protein HYR99_02230 [Candidatus Poribacteria bacterium]|nr:hypothetical protein [Candidatus Poribacteria bacterium]